MKNNLKIFHLLVLIFTLSTFGFARDHNSTYCENCPRDKNGRIARSAEAIREFKKAHPCPSTGKSTGACHGYIIDHVIPLCAGGADDQSNMQWQTAEDAKAKDQEERKTCREGEISAQPAEINP